MLKFTNVCTNPDCITNNTPQRVILVVEGFGTDEEAYLCRDCGARVIYVPSDVKTATADDAGVAS